MWIAGEHIFLHLFLFIYSLWPFVALSFRRSVSVFVCAFNSFCVFTCWKWIFCIHQFDGNGNALWIILANTYSLHVLLVCVLYKETVRIVMVYGNFLCTRGSCNMYSISLFLRGWIVIWWALVGWMFSYYKYYCWCWYFGSGWMCLVVLDVALFFF